MPKHDFARKFAHASAFRQLLRLITNTRFRSARATARPGLRIHKKQSIAVVQTTVNKFSKADHRRLHVDADGTLGAHPHQQPPIRRATAADDAAGKEHADASQAAPAYSERYVWYVILLLSLVNVFSYMDRTALSVLMPLIKADLDLSDRQLGFLVGFSFFLFYAVCGIPIARWADRDIRRDIISITLTIWSLMTALSGAAQNFWHLLVARVGLGAGEAGCIPAAESIISDYVPAPRRSGAYAIHAFGFSAGMMAGLVLAGWLGEKIGWRWTFVALGLPGIAVALLVFLTLKEPIRGASDGARDESLVTPFRETLTTLWHCKTYRLIVLFYIVSGFANSGLVQWWPSFYGRVFDISLSTVGVGLGLAIGAGSGLGTLAGGLLANHAAQRDARLPLLIGAAAVSLALPAAIGSLFIPYAPGSMLLALLTILLWSVPSGSLTATIFTVTRPRMRATTSAITVFFIAVLGFGLGPFCVGMLSDFLAPSFGIEALRYALLLPILALAALGAILYAVTKALPHDLRALSVATKCSAELHPDGKSTIAASIST